MKPREVRADHRALRRGDVRAVEGAARLARRRTAGTADRGLLSRAHVSALAFCFFGFSLLLTFLVRSSSTTSCKTPFASSYV